MTLTYTAAIMANMGHNSLKGMMKIDGRPMIEYVLDAVPEEAEDIVIMCMEEGVEEYKDVGQPYGARTLVGPHESMDVRSQLEPVFQNSKSDGLLVLRCDTPLINRNVTTFLAEIITKFSAGIPRLGIDRPEFIPASYRVSSFLPVMSENPSLPMSEVARKVRNILYISAESMRVFDPKLRFLQRVNNSGDASRAASILRSMREE
ncbi:MAG: NTP transferase domain-containing protein [Nitrososphaerota archaeon]